MKIKEATLTENYFCVLQKNERKQNQPFELLMKNLSRRRKISLLLINSIYLVFRPKYSASFITLFEKDWKRLTNLKAELHYHFFIIF